MTELIEIRPGVWAIKRLYKPPARSELPLPHVISDTMEPTEQVDGRFYTSKSEFRKVGRANGLIEVGTEKLAPKPKGEYRKGKAARQQAIRKAIERTRSP